MAKMLKDLKKKVETKYEDMSNFRKVMENVKNDNREERNLEGDSIQIVRQREKKYFKNRVFETYEIMSCGLTFVLLK